MRKMLKIVEIAWIVIAVISIVELVRMWGDFGQRFWIFLGFGVLAIVMHFVRKRQRQGYEQRMEQREREENP